MERFATATLSLTAFRNELTAAGIVGDRSKKPLVLSAIERVLNNPFYYGVFAHCGELHQGSHVPMISKKTFDDIQKALVTVGKPRHHREETKFLFLNFATCDLCGYSITGERHIKKSGLRFHYYRCTHKSREQRCTARSFVRQEKFAEEVKRNAQLVLIPDEWKEKFLARIETWETETSHEKQQKIDRLKSDLSSLKAKIDRINNGFAEGSIDIVEFKELKNPLVPQKADLEEQITVLERSKANRLEPLRKWVLEANAATIPVSNDNWLEMKSFLENIGSNRLLRSQTLTVTFKTPFDSLAETTLAVRSTTDVSAINSRWWSLRDSNP
ncbi:MAG: recombinase zinc beta ribbon domain-containing protein [Verrucomicrobiota bacterium]